MAVLVATEVANDNPNVTIMRYTPARGRPWLTLDDDVNVCTKWYTTQKAPSATMI
ncbi:MAG: hypothetical protein ACM3WU_05065 [Bacillota bacterium]